MTLEGVRSFRVPHHIVQQSEKRLQEAGRDGYELFVLWSGCRAGDSFQVLGGHVPAQSSYKTATGLVVRIEGEALHKLNLWLFENEQELAVQIHAHPTRAFHSDTDDTFPVVTTVGGLSIVTADFCRHGLFTPKTAFYRLGKASWDPVASEIVQVI